MPALICNELPSDRIESLAGNLDLIQHVLHGLLEVYGQLADAFVLRFEIADLGGGRWVAPAQPLKDQVLLGVMAAIREPGEVDRDRGQDIVVRLLRRIEDRELLLQGIEQSHDVPMLFLQPAQGLWHDRPRVRMEDLGSE
jgi:hypothetical protein